MLASVKSSCAGLALLFAAAVLTVAAQGATHVAVLQPEILHADTLAIHGHTVVVGSASQNGQRGAAYVFVQRNGAWQQQDLLSAPDIEPFEIFGDSAAIHGDTAIVGAWGHQSSGAAYAFVRSGESWSLQAKLMPDDAGPFINFGFSVALQDHTAVMGAPGGEAVYVFVRRSGSWTQQAKLRPLNPPGQNGNPLGFGETVALDDDTLVVGTPFSDGSATGSGSAYVFVRSGGTWSRQAILMAGDAATGDFFGSAVAVSGDTILVGAAESDNPGRSAGAAYLFSRQGKHWQQNAKLLPRDRDGGLRFGAAVALQGDTALIGAPGDLDEGFGAGSVYLYRRHGAAWIRQSKLLSNNAQGFAFGNRVNVHGDIAVLGGFDFKPDVPSAYIFSIVPEPMLRCSDDLDGDGAPELVLVARDGLTTVVALNGTRVNEFAFDAADIVDVTLMPDSNGNGAPELVALDRAGSKAEVRDLRSGGVLATIPLRPYPAVLDGAVIPDRNGNGIPELATLAWRPVLTEVNDGLTGAELTRAAFVNAQFNPRNLLVYPDLNGNGAPELAVLAEHKDHRNSDTIEVRDSADGTLVQQIWLGREWTTIRQALVTDLNANGYDDFAVLRTVPRFNGPGPVSVMLRDGKTRAGLGTVSFPNDHPPSRFFSIPDVNGNGTDELVLFGRRHGFGSQRVLVRDSGSGAAISTAYFNPSAPMQDLTTCPDINGNGAVELVFLGRRTSDGLLRAIIKDSRTAQRLRVVGF